MTKNDYTLGVRLCCKAAGLPMPEPEHKFHDTRKWRFDFAWVKQKVALEVDGGVWVQGRHSRGSGLVQEHEKMNHAASAGWKVFRATPQNVADLSLYSLIKEAL